MAHIQEETDSNLVRNPIILIEIFMVFLNSSRQVPGMWPKVCHDCFPANYFLLFTKKPNIQCNKFLSALRAINTPQMNAILLL